MKIQASDPNIETLYNRISSSKLDLQPSFQRGEVWDLPRKQRLIDTILRNWYVPAVHIVITPDGRHEVLDGQQRLATIRDFMQDAFPIKGDINPVDDAVSAFDGFTFSKLPEPERDAFTDFTIRLITLTDYEPDEPNELFFRLNQSYNLTPPEKRNALHGTPRDQVRALVQDLTSIGLLDPKTVGLSNTRLAHDDIIARCCIALELNTLRKHITNQTVEKFYRDAKGGFSADTLDRVHASGEWLLNEIHNHDAKIRFNKGTLQTWLLYGTRTPPPCSNLLSPFERFRLGVKFGARYDASPSTLSSTLAPLAAIYNDRSAYRVTDVSSVLLRHLIIRLFEYATSRSEPRNSTFNALIDDLSTSKKEPETVLRAFLDQSNWGTDLRSTSL